MRTPVFVRLKEFGIPAAVIYVEHDPGADPIKIAGAAQDILDEAYFTVNKYQFSSAAIDSARMDEILGEKFK